MAKATGNSEYVTSGTQGWCSKVRDPYQTPGKHTPKGLAFWYQWGSLRYAANAAFICLQVSKSLFFHSENTWLFLSWQ